MTAHKRSLEESAYDADGALAHDAIPPGKLNSPTSPTASGASTASSFRNVSACNRCRLRKNRCDQRLPACASCEKAHVKCVGYDPITKREIPRSYVYYLETRVSYLESLLQQNGIPFTPPEAFNPARDTAKPASSADSYSPRPNDAQQHRNGSQEGISKEEEERERLNKLVNNIGMVSVQGASDPRYLGSTSGISFARVVFAAVKSSVSGASSERGSVRGIRTLPGGTGAGGGATSMRDSYFGLHTKPTFRQAPFPDKELALKLVNLYFEHANPQIPILHRGEFMEMFNRIFSDERSRTARESYMLNIVFAIGAGIIMGSSDSSSSPSSDKSNSPEKNSNSPPSHKKRRMTGVQHHPEEYHASAIVHLESFLGSSPAADRPDGFGGGLEELQAVLLLAGFALLRPVAPGLWYIVGVAVRLGVDLGLHYEDGVDIDGANGDDKPLPNDIKPGADDDSSAQAAAKVHAKELGRRQWVRDLRRRLWWCVYSFDRLVSTCVGRPFGITDQVITTEFPSMLDDKYITKEGFLSPPGGSLLPSYKLVAKHYFRLRLLQSEILQVLQHRQAQQARASGANQGNQYMHTQIPSPFLVQFESFRTWRLDIDRRLWEWRESAPTQVDTNVQFSPLFLELNYWQAIIMLYRQSLSVPPVLAGEESSSVDVSSPSMVNKEEREDEDMVYLKVAEAGQNVLKIYRKLHRVHLVNYTFLATHHLFMAGISFLYAIWHSPVVRSHLSLDDVDFTVLAATSVLGDLIEKCPPAEACRDAFDRMSKATIQMCMSTTGFGPQALRGISRPGNNALPSPTASTSSQPSSNMDVEMSGQAYPAGYMQAASSRHSRRPQPRFDMNLRDLFSDEETDARSFGRISNQIAAMRQAPPMQPQLQQQPIKQEPPISPQLQQRQQFSPSQAFNPQAQSLDNNSASLLAQSPPLSSPQQQQSIPNLSATPQMASYFSSSAFPNTSQGPDANSMGASAFANLDLFPDMDFMDSFQLGGGADGQAGNANNGEGVIDIGFGMGGLDGSHDWSEGGGYDLFDGFFFGGGG